jgi:DNA uptake protein ComE-like DNA-binding protein
MKFTQRRVRFLSLSLGLGLLISAFASVASAKDKPAKIDLNTATQQELENLPGVGEATAKKIIAGRPYSKVSDLEKAGVPKSTIDKIKSQVTVSKSSAKSTKTESATSSSSKASETKSGEKTKESKTAEKTEKSSKEKAPAASGPVNLNTATEKELEDLPGVGPATAKKIVAGRPYSSVDDLAKAGVSKSTIGKISSMVTVGAGAGAAAGGAASSSKSTAASSSPSRSTESHGGSSSTSRESAPEASHPAQPPPSKGMVWVNTATKVYHYEGDRWYGNTKEGKYMTEADAIKAGYRASKEGQKKE